MTRIAIYAIKNPIHTPLKPDIEAHLLEDIGNIDKIAHLIADIIFDFEILREEGTVDIDAFKQQTLEQYDFNEREMLLFGRAIERYRAAIQYGENLGTGIDTFLSRTKLNLDKYEGIRAYLDPSMPGVIVIKIKSRKDAVQFDLDTRPDIEIMMEKIATTIPGIKLNIEKRELGSFIGLNVKLKTLGLPDDNGFLSAIVLRDDDTDTESASIVEGVAQHEYAHAIYSGLVVPFAHVYLTGEEKNISGRSISRWTDATKEALTAALGDVSLSDNPPHHLSLSSTLSDERAFLNELRAYAKNAPIFPATMKITELKLCAPKKSREVGVIDPKMAERYLNVHLKMTSIFIKHQLLHLMAQSLLAGCQSLSQADRMLGNLVKKRPDGVINSPQLMVNLCVIVCGIFDGSFSDIIDYKIGNVEIPKDTITRSMLPSKAVFEQAVKDFGESVPAGKIDLMRQIYSEVGSN